jgi:hypothetical protein
MRGISGLTEDLFASQEGPCSVKFQIDIEPICLPGSYRDSHVLRMPAFHHQPIPFCLPPTAVCLVFHIGRTLLVVRPGYFVLYTAVYYRLGQ